MQSLKRAVRKLIPRPIETPPSPVAAEKSAYSAMFSIFDETVRPTKRLINLAITAAEKMLDVNLPESRPGDGIRLLAGLMQALAPKKVVIIGEPNSAAARVIEKFLPPSGRITTIAPDALDLSPAVDAEFILIQGPADGEFERRVLDQLAKVHFTSPPIVMLNDTRLWPMLRFWRDIQHPKLDVTSFGSWSGTLLVELA